MRLGDPITLAGYQAALDSRALEVPQEVQQRLQAARAVVDAAVAGAAPVYGLNTGLGANLGHRIAPDDIAGFQRQLIEGRAVAVGPALPPQTGRAVLLARLIGASVGHSGMSLEMFDHLCAVWRSGLSPMVPAQGSIGASDLTQNATWALGVLGQGQMWDGTDWLDAGDALDAAGLAQPALQPKDAMALINHSATSVALAGTALAQAQLGFDMLRHASVLSFEGYAANPQIFAAEVHALRPAPGQAEMAAWYTKTVQADSTSMRVQDALSFRTLAPVMGAAQDALARAITVWQDELNGASDSPAVLAGDAMCSTPNFQSPVLALALEGVSLAFAMAAHGAVMRVQRLMDPALTGLPKYLSPIGGASAGFVPLQKTAAALLGDIRRHAMPVTFDAAPVSDGVEDMATMVPLAARKLSEQMASFHLLAGIEAVVAAQARDLRDLPATKLHKALRQHVAMLIEDRALGTDVSAAGECLAAHCKAAIT